MTTTEAILIDALIAYGQRRGIIPTDSTVYEFLEKLTDGAIDRDYIAENYF